MKTTIDCIAMKRQGALRLLEIISPMSLDEELAFWKRGTEEMLQEQKREQSSRAPDQSHPAPPERSRSGSHS
jgi:hypothetical protein